MKKVLLLLCVVVLGVGGVLLLARNKDRGTSQNLVPDQLEASKNVVITQETLDTLTIRGTVTAMQTNCIEEGICSVTINDFKIITNEFTSAPPTAGSTRSIGSHIGPPLKVGSKVEAYGRKVAPKAITLIGSKDYYTKNLD